MLEDKKDDQVTLEEAKEALETAKDQVTEARKAVRSFKKENKIRGKKAPEDEALAEELAELEGALEEALAAKDAAQEVLNGLKPAKGAGGGGKKYVYGQVTDAESGEPRDLTKPEEKRWRGHARKVAKKEDNEYSDPSQVTFDPTFFDPKPKKEKKEKEEKADPEADAKPKKARRKKEKEEED